MINSKLIKVLKQNVTVVKPAAISKNGKVIYTETKEHDIVCFRGIKTTDRGIVKTDRYCDDLFITINN